ncbi:hypothetical protein CEUSTIGMA_g8131.t1 [Chlamydomonas eustigma]|uniref:Uncharacterized protein n=1 Tax=Chlamydomonas eustigma TaxID=1157962 RepID=A0A250XCB1_9CHLO|nr:hypothetical protein CEUSTIGMA_g8131.t1 [Chlamydomonas eustigma]|eukprot:GAX80696.1 hypothetical protein CEUSTIGMA_g8131.t1 [Chlamydomonas eustigma]
MRKIHAITASGQIVVGVEVFRLLYEAVGLGYLYAIIKFEPIGRLAETVYNVWAKYRMEVTGREAIDVLLTRRREKMLQEAGSMCNAQEGDAASCSVSSEKK